MKPKTLAEIRKMEDHTDWERFNKEGDFEGSDDEDFDVDWDQAVLVIPEPKTPISLRLDSDILEFFKSQGQRLSDPHQRCFAGLYGRPKQAALGGTFPWGKPVFAGEVRQRAQDAAAPAFPFCAEQDERCAKQHDDGKGLTFDHGKGQRHDIADARDQERSPVDDDRKQGHEKDKQEDADQGSG